MLSGTSYGNDLDERGTGSTTYLVHRVAVTIVAATCVVNNNQEISVEFGDNILTTSVNGIDHKKEIPYTVKCSAGQRTQLRFLGDNASFNANYIKTSAADLGIAFSIADGSLLKNGQWMDFDSSSPPKLYAVPVKNQTAELSGGLFTASAVLQVRYP